MQIIIGNYAPDTGTVAVTFTSGEITHSRDVNACHDADGRYDPEATAERVDAVALGVAEKIAVGAIVVAPLVDEAGEPAA